MVEPKFIEAIGVISEQFKKEQIKWALVGSTNMNLQGMNTNPHDLDIVVRFEDLSKMQRLFHEYAPSQIARLKPIVNEVNEAWEVKANICSVEVQFFADRDPGIYASKLLGSRLVHLKVKAFEVPCFTLEAESQAYAETNRQEKADRIREFIKNKPKS